MKPMRSRGRTAALIWLSPTLADIIDLTCPCHCGGQVQLTDRRRNALGRYVPACLVCGRTDPHNYQTLREAIPGAWAFFQPGSGQLDMPRRRRSPLYSRDSNQPGATA